MQTYMVGGAVRDALLGLPVNDRDWVVVGATPEEMVLAGYLPVGRDFPVFLHPQTREEYALARTERKTGRGYHGFAFHADPEVTLEEDLARRDLTINAMAQDETGAVIDPFHGREDLRRKVLRHVTEAFREDPVRILRLARFAARFADFRVAPETLALMRGMVEAGEADALVPERVWQELSRGLMEDKPSRMLEVLRSCGALARLLPEVDALWGVPQRVGSQPAIDTGAHLLRVLDMCAQLQASLAVRYACLVHDLGKATAALGQRLRVPTECNELADVVAREHGNVHRSAELDAAELVRLLERCDAFRKPQRFGDVLLACECDARGGGDVARRRYEPRARLAGALQAAQQVNTATIASAAQAQGLRGPQVGERIHAARVDAVQRWLAQATSASAA
jgi:tRNA nucleotidyltransferase (CCA-adding enzyme)